MTEDAPELDDRPWERPGAVRRDREPHRGELLKGPGVVSLVSGILSLCLLLPCLMALPLGVGVWVASSQCSSAG